MSPEKLVYMANQIGRFFATQSQDKAVPGIRDHITKFWDPRMRRVIIEVAASGGAGLDPVALQAVLELAPVSDQPGKA